MPPSHPNKNRHNICIFLQNIMRDYILEENVHNADVEGAHKLAERAHRLAVKKGDPKAEQASLLELVRSAVIYMHNVPESHRGVKHKVAVVNRAIDAAEGCWERNDICLKESFMLNHFALVRNPNVFETFENQVRVAERQGLVRERFPGDKEVAMLAAESVVDIAVLPLHMRLWNAFKGGLTPPPLSEAFPTLHALREDPEFSQKADLLLGHAYRAEGNSVESRDAFRRCFRNTEKGLLASVRRTECEAMLGKYLW